jgi:glutamate---cysteine ligase / carboxylate-amine ligase
MRTAASLLHRTPRPPGSKTDLLPHRFGSSPPLSLGIEEELLLVDRNRLLHPGSLDLMAALPSNVCQHIASELFAAQIEVKSGICRRAEEAIAQLNWARQEIVDAGFRLLGAGLHPRGGFADAPIVSRPRYLAVLEDLRGLLRTPPCALHVHVGMPGPETAIRVANGLRRHVPSLQALTANSPFWHGIDSGMASARTAILRSYPRIEMPRAFADYEDFSATVADVVRAAEVDDYTFIWWDVRPHPRLGTIEVRAMDTQASAGRSAAIAALIQALAAREMECPTGDDLPREAHEECHRRAARHGLTAHLSRADGSSAPAVEVIGEMLEQARPFARELGTDAALEELDAVCRDGNGADEQRQVFEASGMSGLLVHLNRCTEALPEGGRAAVAP